MMRKTAFYLITFFLVLTPLASVFAQYENTPDDDENAPQMSRQSVDDMDSPIMAQQSSDQAIDEKYLSKRNKPQPCNQCWFAGFGLGAASVKPSTTIIQVPNSNGFPPPGDTDEYATNTYPASFLFSVEGGYQFYAPRSFASTYYLGLRYRYFLDSEIQGNVTEENNPSTFNNYAFTTTASIHVFTLFAKVDLTRFGNFSPYVSGGVGLAEDFVNSYSETSLGATTRTSPGFGSKSSTGLAYEAGLGMDYYLKQIAIFSLGYDYLHLGGTLSTGNGTQAWSNASLNFGTLNANTVIFRTTYIFRT